MATAYGWPASVLSDPAGFVARLRERNATITAGEVDYDPFPPLPAPEAPGDRLFTPEGELPL